MSANSVVSSFVLAGVVTMALGIMAWGPGRVSSDYLGRGFIRLPEFGR